MNEKEARLFNILKNSYSPVSSIELARKLNVSDKSVRNYIKSLRDQGYDIEADKSGYSIKGDNSDRVPSVESIIDFSSSDRRIDFIIEKLILSDSEINLWDLADNIFISYSTLEKDIPKIKNKLSDYELSLSRKKGNAEILGSEKNKRKLISDLLLKDSHTIVNSAIDPLCEDIGITHRRIKEITTDALSKTNLYVSDFGLQSILTHLMINLARITISKYTLENPLFPYDNHDSQEYECADSIYREISSLIDIKINKAEIEQLAFIITTKTTNSSRTDNPISDAIGNELYSFVETIIEEIKKIYYIDLRDQDFINFFSVHLNNALYRAKHNAFSSNPLSDRIYIQNPLIYDIAVYIAHRIREVFNCSLNRDEITFVSLHVGAILEKKANNPAKYKALFLVNNYYNYYQNDQMINSISNRLDNQVDIIVINSLNNIDLSEYDLLIDTTQKTDSVDLPVVNTSPFLTDQDIRHIQEQIDNISVFRQNQELRNKFLRFFDSRLFERNHYESSPEDMIRYIADRLAEMGLAGPDFAKTALEREALTPTSFDNLLAVPHSILSSTVKNFGYVIVNDKPMQWGHFPVRIIILIGINHEERNEFKDLYNSLFEKFMEQGVVDSVLKVSDFSEFINCLVE